MVVQVIQSRYTVEFDVLVAFLSSLFGPSSCEIVVRVCFSKTRATSAANRSRQVPDEGEKWKVKVPRELTRVSVSRG
jgi:hypothetical protein